MVKKEFEYTLSEVLKCQHVDKQSGASEILEVTRLTLKAPTYKNQAERIVLKQLYMQAIASLQKNVEAAKSNTSNTPDDEITGDVIISILYMSNIDIAQFVKAFEKLLFDVCFIDGKVKLNKDLLNRIDPNDFEAIMGEYIANFIMPS